ncbi:hypothetical protein A2U01_0010811, partial [Trifolium medium]|nr:hypothetical protein [Trifolium medium]
MTDDILWLPVKILPYYGRLWQNHSGYNRHGGLWPMKHTDTLWIRRVLVSDTDTTPAHVIFTNYRSRYAIAPWRRVAVGAFLNVGMINRAHGLVLSLGGFLSFMITGSIAAIRFGVILGGVLLALSISSLKSYKKGQPSSLALKGQTGHNGDIIYSSPTRMALKRASELHKLANLP